MGKGGKGKGKDKKGALGKGEWKPRSKASLEYSRRRAETGRPILPLVQTAGWLGNA